VGKEIKIYGAGISGLVAAISLAKSGFKVEVREKSSQVGGHPKWHPSVHQQVFDLVKTSKYIDIDITSCFHPARKLVYYLYGNKIKINNPKDSYICEKGRRSSSIENYLYSEAKKLGISFVFGDTFDPKIYKHSITETHQCIVATGLEPKPYQDLDIKHTNIQAFRSSQINRERDSVIFYFGDYTNYDFAYVASFGNLLFSLLFARRGVSKENLDIFCRHLMKSEKLSFDGWYFSIGCVPLEQNFVKNRFVLAGTISGMIDPFYLNGISGALISGKIAALFFINKQRAFREFNRFTHNFQLKKNFKLISDKLPGKKYSFPFFALLNNYLKCVGVI